MQNKNKKILMLVFCVLTVFSVAVYAQDTKTSASNALISAGTSVLVASAENIDFKVQAIAPTVTKSTLTFTTTEGAATQKGDIITITKPGTYQISGNSADGQIIIDVDKTVYNNSDTDKVTLVLNGVNIFSKNSAPIYVKNIEDKVIIELAKNTVNYITDGASRTDASINGAIYSADDLNIKGEGSLIVRGNFEDGIASKNDIKIKSGSIEVTAKDDAIRGKDSVTIEDGTLTLQSEGDGIKATETDDAEKGYVTILGGSMRIKARNDGIQAETNLTIEDGSFEIFTLEGSSYIATAETSTGTSEEADTNEETDSSDSYKALKAGNDLTISGGDFTIDSSDDAIHANGNITINGGDFKIASADDAVHADGIATLNGGNMIISKSVEGIEAAQIIVNDGYFNIISEDDGLNASDGSGSVMGGNPMRQAPENNGNQPMMSGNRPTMAPPVNADGSAATNGQATKNGNLPPEPPRGGQGPSFADGNRPAAPPTQAPPVNTDGSASTNKQRTDLSITINGGTLILEAGGDGIDSNGSLTFNGGSVFVTSYGQGDSAIDADGIITTNGGTILGVGSAGMAQGASNADSKQASILVNTSLQAGKIASITDKSGNALITFAPSKNIQSVYFSSKDLKIGENYNLLTGVTYTGGNEKDSIYTGGKYTGGSTAATSTAAATVSGGMNMGGMNRGDMNKGGTGKANKTNQ